MPGSAKNSESGPKVTSAGIDMPNLKYQWRRLRNKLKMNKIGRLPVELYLDIIEQVERREDLYNLLFVSRDFYYTAEKVLYRTINLEGPKQLQFFRTIISNERMARSVQSLTIFSRLGLPLVTRAAKNYWVIFHQALRATHNLKRLYWLSTEVIWPYFPLELFPGCTFQLHTLVIRCPDVHTMFNHAFLALQTELVELNLLSSNPPFLCPNVFPKLTTLTLSCGKPGQPTPALVSIISRPSLRALNAPNGFFFPIPFPAQIFITSLQIRYYHGPEVFLSILPAFHCLRFLRIDQIAAYPNGWLTWENMLEYIFVQTALLGTLEKLSLDFIGYPTLPYIFRVIREMAVARLGNIQVINVGRGPTEACVQWLRGSEGEKIVQENGMEWRDECWH